MACQEPQLTNDTQRMYVVWDSYPPDYSLKALAQQRRGNDSRTRVNDGNTSIPKSEWSSGFLENEDNKKEELFSLISGHERNSPEYTHLSSEDTLRWRAYQQELSCIIASTMQQGRDGHQDTHGKACVSTVDGDIAVFAVRLFETLGLSALWMGFGSGKRNCDI